MGSIPKIVSTPLKWVSKKIIHHTLLRFPGGDSHSPIACVYCPEMCRFSCPTAVVSGNDTVTPCNKMGLLYKEDQWPTKTGGEGEQLWPLYDCTGCGRCTEYCLYEMPVAEKLFQARKKFKWDTAEKIARELTDELDPVGDLAEELGDSESSDRRSAQFIKKGNFEVAEPRSLYFLNQKGYAAVLESQSLFQQPLSPFAKQKLSGKTWLLHESVWLNRHLGRPHDFQNWIETSREDKKIEFEMPFAHGIDCVDCGGEGIYSRMFPSQARQMALEIWERDQHRVQGILCVSQRCADHFKKSLDLKVPVVSLAELKEP